MARLGWRKPDGSMASLREALLMSRTSENILDMPERIARVIELFNSPHLHPHFREDIYKILSGSVDLSLALATPTFPSALACERISSLMTVLARILGHLQERPTAGGYAVMLPATGQLVGAFTTHEEAAQHAKLLCELGGKTCEVVPVQITSTISTQPRKIGADAPSIPVSDYLDDPIPLESPSVPNTTNPTTVPPHPSSDGQPATNPTDLSSSSPVLSPESPVSPPDGSLGNGKN